MTRQSQQNLISMTSSGEAQAIFPGGVQILAGETTTPPDERQIRWVRESDGSVVARIQTGGADPASFGTQTELTGYRVEDFVPGLDVSQTALVQSTLGGGGLPDALGPEASVRALVDDRNPAGGWPQGRARIEAQAFHTPASGEPSQRILMDWDGASSFIGNATLETPTDVRIIALAGVAVAGMAAAGTVLSGVIDTGMRADDNRPTGSLAAGRLPFSFVRIWGSFINFAGNQLGWGYTTSVGGPPNVNVQFQFRNNSTVASAATTFVPIVMIGYA